MVEIKEFLGLIMYAVCALSGLHIPLCVLVLRIYQLLDFS
jgi:hypothetical protein